MIKNEDIKKDLIQRVRKHYQDRYSDIFKYIMQEDSNLEDIELLLANEPNFFDDIRRMRKETKEKEQEKEFDSKIKINTFAQDVFLEMARDEKRMINEAILRTELRPAYTNDEILTKENRIKKLNARLQNIEELEQRLSNIVREMQPEKRPVGRPKKIKEKNDGTEQN